MAIVTITTTKEDWETAECYSPQNCVLARAIKRGARNRGWRVEGDAVRNLRPDVYCYMPDWARQEAKNFDSKGRMSVDTILGMVAKRIPDFGFSLIRFRFNTETGEMFDMQEVGEISEAETLLKRIETGAYELTDEQQYFFERIERLLKADEKEFQRLACLFVGEEDEEL